MRGEWGGESKGSRATKIFSGLPRHSLLRKQIFTLISNGFYLSSRGEIISLMPLRAVLSGDF